MNGNGEKPMGLTGFASLSALIITLTVSFLLIRTFSTELHARLMAQTYFHHERAGNNVSEKAFRKLPDIDPSPLFVQVGRTTQGRRLRGVKVNAVDEPGEIFPAIFPLFHLFQKSEPCLEIDPLLDEGQTEDGRFSFTPSAFRSAFSCTNSFLSPFQQLVVGGNFIAEDMIVESAPDESTGTLASRGYLLGEHLRSSASELTVIAGGDLFLHELSCYSVDQVIHLVSLSGSIIIDTVSGCESLYVFGRRGVYVPQPVHPILEKEIGGISLLSGLVLGLDPVPFEKSHLK